MIRIMPASISGPLSGAPIERLSRWLLSEGYTPAVSSQVLAVARGWSAWFDDNSVPLSTVDMATLDDFCHDYGLGVPGHALVTGRIAVICRFMIESGQMPGIPVPAKRPRPPIGKQQRPLSVAVSRELEAWAVWQSTVQGVGAGCIRHRRTWISGFVESLCSQGEQIDWSLCTVAAVNGFVRDRSAGFTPASATGIVDACRSLLRWALASGRITTDLTGGLLHPRSTRVGLPRGLTQQQVYTLLEACDRSGTYGIRDFAVITLLWRLGIRAGEAAGLTLQDIDWAAHRLCVIGKNNRRLVLPIPVDVGEALVAWLRVRPTQSPSR